MSSDPLHPSKVLITPKTYDTEHEYINLDCLKSRQTLKHNSNSMGRGVVSSHPRYHPTKKRTTDSHQNPTQTFSSSKHPRTDPGEDPHPQMTHEITVEHAQKALLPPCDEVEHEKPISHCDRLIGTYRYDTWIHLCQYVSTLSRGDPRSTTH